MFRVATRGALKTGEELVGRSSERSGQLGMLFVLGAPLRLTVYKYGVVFNDGCIAWEAADRYMCSSKGP
jgi:hypothetical protein